jgi:glucose uptake protein GlcU
MIYFRPDKSPPCAASISGLVAQKMIHSCPKASSATPFHDIRCLNQQNSFPPLFFFASQSNSFDFSFLMLSFFLILLLVGPLMVRAVGCGEYSDDPLTTCSDWQCSRALQVNNITFCVRGSDLGSSCRVNGDCYHEMECLLGVCVKTASSKEAWKGFLGIGVATLCFGSNFIPVKKLKTGNGILFQQFMSLGILLVGITAQLVRGTPTLYPLAMIGGMMWAIGNSMAVLIIRFVGMGLAITTWSSSNMLIGWASGHFGIWGVAQEKVHTPWMSYCGVAVAAASICLFSQVKPTTTATEADVSPVNEDIQSMPSKSGDALLWYDQRTTEQPHLSLPKRLRTVVGLILAICAGVCYGFMFDPAQGLMDDYSTKSLVEDVKYSPDGLDYVLSCFLGIFMTSTAICFLFHMFESWLPTLVDDSAVNARELFVPAVISGIMWGIAAVSWFVANTNVGLVISFPLMALGPSLVALLWGALVFGEIRGARNVGLILLIFALRGVSCFFTVYSRQ